MSSRKTKVVPLRGWERLSVMKPYYFRTMDLLGAFTVVDRPLGNPNMESVASIGQGSVDCDSSDVFFIVDKPKAVSAKIGSAQGTMLMDRYDWVIELKVIGATREFTGYVYIRPRDWGGRGLEFVEILPD